MSSSSVTVPVALYQRLSFLKGRCDTAMGWNMAIQEALEDPELKQLMLEHGIERKDVRHYLSGRIQFQSPSNRG